MWARLHNLPVRQFLVVFAVLAAPIVALGHGTVDQEFSGPYQFGLRLDQPGGAGQSFTPVAENIGSVDIMLTAVESSAPADMTVSLLGGLSGPVLATVTVPLPGGVEGTPENPIQVHIEFPTAVAVVPGTQYYLWVDQVNEEYSWAAAMFDPFPSGGGFLETFAQRGVDLGFRTYTAPTEPATIGQCQDGGWRTFTSPRAFKNQGDCIRFVNTGK